VQVRGYLNTTSRAFTRALDNSAITFPTPLTAGEDIILKFQLSQEIAGFVERLDLPVSAIKARIGKVKTAAEAGSYILDITLGSDTVTTAAIAWDAAAATVKSAIDTALGSTISSLNPCVVTAETGGAYRIHFADNEASVQIEVSDNSLWPLAFVNVEEQAHDDGYTYILSHQQTPCAESTTLGTRAPDLPVVSRKQGGSDEDGILINEIQKIVIPPSFAGGTFRLSRGGVKSGLLPLPISVNALAEALRVTADTNGAYLVSASSNAFFIEFTGSMAGTAQDLFTVVGFDVPASDYYVKLSTDTAAMTARMRRAGTTGEVEMPLHLTVYVENEIDEEEDDRFDFSFPLTFTSPPGDDEHNASIDLIWDQPPSRLDSLPHSTSAVMVGHRSYRKVIGNGSDVEFSIPHNLGANPQTVTADASTNAFTGVGHNFQNGDAVTFSSTTSVPAPLVAGTTYWVRDRTDDTFKVSLLQGGAAIDLTNAGTGTITARVDDGPSDGYHVTVYERTGDRARIPDNAYTVELTSDDALTISGFASTPTSNQYVVHVTKIGRVATYQELELPQARVIDLVTDLDAIRARLTAVENGNFPGAAPAAGTVNTSKIDRTLKRVWNVLRARTLPAAPASLVGWDPFAEGSPLRDIRLLPAVHVASGSIEALPAILPAPDSTYRGRVFYSAVDVPGLVSAGQYAACSGLEWYRVRRESDSESTWYPTAMEMEFFRLSISPDELPLRTRLDLAIGLEMALYDPSRRPADRRTVGRMSLILERGVRTTDSSPSTTGSNIASHFASPVILAQHDFDLTAEVAQKKFTLSIARDGAGALTALASKMMGAAVTVSAPASADFALRLRLARVDFENLPTDGRGILAVRGPDVGLDGKVDQTVGRYGIS
jgi:hypothetical protein